MPERHRFQRAYAVDVGLSIRVRDPASLAADENRRPLAGLEVVDSGERKPEVGLRSPLQRAGVIRGERRAHG